MSGAPDGIVVGTMALDDLPAVLAIERASFRSPWTEDNFRHEIEGNPVAINRVLRVDGALAGYACAYLVADELQINDLAVLASCRRRGLAGRLLEDVFAVARARGGVTATLEVRPGNAAARRLYARHGFEEVGRRPGYYPESGEDAILMARAL